MSSADHAPILFDNKVVKDEALLAHIARLPHGRANQKQLLREFGGRGIRREEIERSLARLTRKGLLLEVRPFQFQAASKSRDLLAGTLRMHRDGFGFVSPDEKPEGLDGDLFINADSAQKAMHGDKVLVRMGRIGPDGRAHGDIVKVLHRANQRMVGEFRITRRGHFVAPYDERIKQWIHIPEGFEIPQPAVNPDRVGIKAVEVNSIEDLDRMMVTVEILEFPDEDQNGIGRLVEILGRKDDFGVDVEILIRKHHLPHEFPADVLEEARAVSREIGPREWEGRRDFRDYDIVTIDGETARDFDDAVWCARLDNGNYALHVHIADVSYYVRPGSPLDHEAALRGTSVYFPDRAVPMLPLELSTDICSLRPNEERLVSSVLLEIDPQGNTVAQEFTRGVIRSRERMTYTRVHELLEVAPQQAGRFALMKELALILNRMRAKRGSIDFDLPEPLIEFDQFGEMTGVTRSPRNIAHRLIEEFMLAANEAVAAELVHRGRGGIYRIHEIPDSKRVLEFEETASKFGHSLGLAAVPVKKFMNIKRTRDGRKLRKDVVISDARSSVTSHHYQRLVSRIEGKPEERIVSYLMLRSLKQAKYSNENLGHFALAAENYTHFTSPIRRYPDLIVHRLLHGEEYEDSQLAEIAEDTSFTERRAAEAERELVEWKKTKFMLDKVGEEFDGLVISTTKYGFFVELADLFIEGLVPIDTLPKDRYLYHENTRKLIGERTKRAFSIGDKVHVVLVKVDESDKRLTFMLKEEPKKK
jgi:ribonuclease R